MYQELGCMDSDRIMKDLQLLAYFELSSSPIRKYTLSLTENKRMTLEKYSSIKKIQPWSLFDLWDQMVWLHTGLADGWELQLYHLTVSGRWASKILHGSSARVGNFEAQ